MRLKLIEAADEVGDPPDRFAVDQRHFAGAGIDGIDRDVGGGFRAAEHDDLLPLDDGGHRCSSAECRIPPPAALKASSPGWLSVWRSLNWPVQTATKSNSSSVTAPSGFRISSVQPGRPRTAARHADDGGVEPQPLQQAVVPGVVGQIGMNLRSLGPFRIGVRHRLVGIAIEILRALGLNVGIGTRRLPDAAEIAAASRGSSPCVRARRMSCRGKPGDAGTDNTHVLLLDHGPALLVRRSAVCEVARAHGDEACPRNVAARVDGRMLACPECRIARIRNVRRWRPRAGNSLRARPKDERLQPHPSDCAVA